MNPALTYLIIAMGSALGGAARYGCGQAMLAWLGPAFPWGTIFINIGGSFVIGWFATLTGPDGKLLLGSLVRQFVMTGICGGFTTFSAFSLDTFTLLERGAPIAATANVGLSLILSLIFVWIGYRVAARINK